MKTPTDAEKIQMYEGFLHDINMYCVCGQNDKIKQLVWNADNFSYSYRCGNGMLSEEEQQDQINGAFWRLRRVE